MQDVATSLADFTRSSDQVRASTEWLARWMLWWYKHISAYSVEAGASGLLGLPPDGAEYAGAAGAAGAAEADGLDGASYFGAGFDSGVYFGAVATYVLVRTTGWLW